MLSAALLAILSSPFGALPAPLFSASNPAYSFDDVDDRIKSLLKSIEKHRDATRSWSFEKVASYRTKAALKGLKKSVTWLREERAISAAYAAFAAFAESEELREDAVEYLEAAALGNRRRESAPVAAATLGKFGAYGRDAAMRVAEESGNAEVRWAAIRPQLTHMATKGDAESLELILSSARPALDDEIKEVKDALVRFRSLPHRRSMVEAIAARGTGSGVRMILMDRFASDTEEATTEAMIACLSLRDPAVQRRAIEILSERPDSEKASAKLWSLLDADDPQLKLVAIEGLGKLAKGDDRWQARLRVLAKESDPLSRRGAARAYPFQPRDVALAALLGMLEDEDWRVRLEATRQLGAVHDASSIAPLIARMAVDTGRLRRATADALRGLTGEDHGNSPDRWASWWTGEGGAGYVLPSAEEAAARLAKLEKSRAQRDSVATFYDLPVFSDRVAFVVDTSGSMNAKTFLGEDDAEPSLGTQGVTAMVYARRELKKLIERMPDGAHCNIIFFHDDVDAWKRGLTPLSGSSRKKAIRFIDKSEASGGTALYDGLIEAFEDDEVDTIYLLSDGLPSTGEIIDPEEVRSAIAELNAVREVEIHGIDLSRASLVGMMARIVPLVRWLAEDSGGRFIAPGPKLAAPGGNRGR